MKKSKLIKGTLCLTAISAMTLGQLSPLNNVFAATYAESFHVDSLTLQPGNTTTSINVTWYAPKDTTLAKIKFGQQVIEVSPQQLTQPTKVDTNKYKDTDKVVCKATITGLQPSTEYKYQISNDGKNWSNEYTYTTPSSDEFKFGFISDPQIKESGESDNQGWNPSDGTNQTGWASMMETLDKNDVNLVVSAGDQVEDQSWGKSSEYEAFFAPEEMSSIPFAPAVGNHDRHYMFRDHFNLPNQMDSLDEVKTSFRGQNSGTSQSHGNYIQATLEELNNQSESNGVVPNEEGYYDFQERRTMETEGNYYYLYNNVLFVTLNTGAYPGGNDEESGTESGKKDNSEAKQIINNFNQTLKSATNEYKGKYNWIIVSHHKSTQTVAKHAADSDIENYVDAGFEKLMDQYDVDFVLGGHDHVYSRSYVLKDGKRNSEKLDTINNPDGTIYLTGNCSSDMQYYDVFDKLDKINNSDYPILANGEKGSQAYLKGESLPVGNQEWNQEFSPSYAIFDVKDDQISVKVYNLDGDSSSPTSKQIDSFTVTKKSDDGKSTQAFDNENSSLAMEQIARYNSHMTNAEGGVMEIVDYNTTTGWAYAINGQSGQLTAIDMSKLENNENIELLDGNDIDIKSMVEEADSHFKYGDMTSVAMSHDNQTLAVALQAAQYNDQGRIAIFNCLDNGELSLQKIVNAGIQPDNIIYSLDDKYILTANEGEPRQGYENGEVDPQGSISVVNTSNFSVKNVGFDEFDSQRDELVKQGIVIKKGSNPSTDFEPEYISVTDKYAYISLQEANAIAVMDLNSQKIINIYSAGFEDYSQTSIDIDKKDEKYDAKTYNSLKGIRMPDGIATATINGVDYIFAANEGDSREWGNYLNEVEVNFGKDELSPSGKMTSENTGLTGKVVFFDTSDYDGLNSGTDYLFGGRSMTVYKMENDSMKEVYSTQDEFEKVTAKYLGEYFNCSNDDISIDDRSGKKGVEAESVTIGQIDNHIYAFVGLERIGGIMVYDITDPTKTQYVNYINSRDFTNPIAGDDSPEGLKFIAGENGNAKLIGAYEVSGTVGVYDLNVKDENTTPTPDPTPNPDPNPTPDPTPNPNSNPTPNPDSGSTLTPNIDVEDTTSHQQGESNIVKTSDQTAILTMSILVISSLAGIYVMTKKRRNM